MDWWKRRKSRACEKKQRLVRGRERGGMLLEDLIECCDGKSNPIRIFSADQIIKATYNVCKCTVPQKNPDICECTRVSELPNYGGWYSGMLDNHRILIQKLWHQRFPNPKGFYCLVHDIAISSMVSGHKNFMKLVGCCLETEIPFMVYYGEIKQYSHLDLHKVLSWRKRMKIAEDIATSLTYLHTAFSRPFVYCKMDLRNILLDEDGVAKLSDFSYCVSIPRGETFVKVGYVRGNWGGFDYFDVDYSANGVVSEKTDAFGFEILMQKLLTGEERFDQLYGSRWLSESVGEGRIDELVDPKMLEKTGQVSEEERFRMEAFLVLSDRCIGLRGEVPEMVEVAKELKKILRTASSSPSGETQIDPSSVLLQNAT